MTQFKDVQNMTDTQIDIYEGELLIAYKDRFGEAYKMRFFHRPDPKEVVTDIIRCLKTGEKQVWNYPPISKNIDQWD